MERNYKLGVVLDADGDLLIAEFDEATGAIKRTTKAADALGDEMDQAGREAEKSGRRQRKASKETARLGKSYDQARKGGAKFKAFLTGALVTGLALAIRRTINYGDETVKLSTRLDVSTRSLSEYDHVAKSTGITTQTLTTAWQRQTRRVAEAARGTGEAAGALRELNIDAKKFKDLAPDEQFEILADALGDVGSQSDKVRLAMRLWDTEGVALLQTIENGSAGLREMRAEARALGKSLSTEDAQALSDAKQNMDRLDSAVEGLALRFTTDLVPGITTAVEYITGTALPAFTSFLEKIGALEKSLAQMSRTEKEAQRDEYQDRIVELGNELQRRQIAASDPGIFGAAQRFFNEYHTTDQDIVEEMERLAHELVKVEASLAGVDSQSEETSESLDETTAAADRAGVSLTGAGQAALTLGQIFAGEAPNVQQFVAMLEGQINALQQTEAEQLRAMATTMKAQLTNEALGGTIDGLVEKYIALAAAEKAEQERTQAMNEARQTFTQTLATLEQQYAPLAASARKWQKVEEQLLKLVGDEKTDQELLARTLEWVKQAREDEANAVRDQLEPHRQILQQMDKENEALQLAIERHISLEAAKYRVNGASEAQLQQFLLLEQQGVALSDQYEYMTNQADPMALAWEEAIKRVDEVFADAWAGAFDSFDDFKDGLLDAFKRMIAEMAHIAITRPILIRMGLGGGGGFGGFAGAAAAAGGVPAQGFGYMPGDATATLPGGGFGGGGMGFNSFGQFGNFLGGSAYPSGSGFFSQAFLGNGVGETFTGLPGFLGGGETGIFSGAGQYANWQYGLAGVLGYLGGDLLFPDTKAGIGGSSGATIGMAVGGPWGALIGGLIGAVAGAFFKNRKLSTTLGGRDYEDGDNPKHTSFQTALGTVVGIHGSGGYGDFGGDPNDPASMLEDAITNLDQAAAELLSPEQLEAAKERLRSWGGTWTEEALTVENVIESRLSAILEVVSQEVRDFVGEADTLEDRLQRFRLGQMVDQMITNNQGLFGDATLADVAAAAKVFEGAGMDLGQAMQAIAQRMQAGLASVEVLRSFTESNLNDDFSQLMAIGSRSVFDQVMLMGGGLREMSREFDGTLEGLVAITQATGQYRQATLQLMAQYEQAEQQISSDTGLQDQIEREMFGEQYYYEQQRGRAEALAQQLQFMEDPQQIAATRQQILQLVSNARGALDEDQLREMNPEILEFIRSVDALAISRLADGRSQVGADYQDVQSSIDTTLQDLPPMLDLIIAGVGDLTTALDENTDAINSPAPAPAPPSDSPPGETPGSVEPNSISDQVNRALVQAFSTVDSRIAEQGDNTVNAIRAGLSEVQINITVDRRNTLVGG